MEEENKEHKLKRMLRRKAMRAERLSLIEEEVLKMKRDIEESFTDFEETIKSLQTE